MPRIFDCFPFFNELDLLQVRLETMDPVVDFFVIAESPVTYRGEPKPMHFLENRDRFGKFLHKIRHVSVDDIPRQTGFHENWERETHQRGALERGLHDGRDDDIVMMSDLDEIPRPEKILQAVRAGKGLRIFKMRFFAYFANCEPHPGNWWWNGTGMSEYRLARGRFESILRKLPTRLMPGPGYGLRKRISIQLRIIFRCRLRGIPVTFIREGGHHFSWLGGARAVLRKRGAISIHRGETFPDDYLTMNAADKAVCHAASLARLLDETMPPVLREPRFSNLLAPVHS